MSNHDRFPRPSVPAAFPEPDVPGSLHIASSQLPQAQVGHSRHRPPPPAYPRSIPVQPTHPSAYASVSRSFDSVPYRHGTASPPVAQAFPQAFPQAHPQAFPQDPLPHHPFEVIGPRSPPNNPQWPTSYIPQRGPPVRAPRSAPLVPVVPVAPKAPITPIVPIVPTTPIVPIAPTTSLNGTSTMSARRTLNSIRYRVSCWPDTTRLLTVPVCYHTGLYEYALQDWLLL
ncbi:hypothetical protein V8E53_011869 [Lactarius tabidus]